MIDAIKSHSGMSYAEQNKIIDKLLDDSELKNLIMNSSAIVASSLAPLPSDGPKVISKIEQVGSIQ